MFLLSWRVLGRVLESPAFLDDFLAERYAFIADIHMVWPGDEPLNLLLAFVTE